MITYFEDHLQKRYNGCCWHIQRDCRKIEYGRSIQVLRSSMNVCVSNESSFGAWEVDGLQGPPVGENKPREGTHPLLPVFPDSPQRRNLYLIHTSTFVHLCHGIPGNAHAITSTFRGIIYGTASRLSMMIAYLVFCLSRIIGDSLMLRLSSIPSPSKQIWSSTREKSLNMVMEFPMTWWLYLSSSTNSLVAHLSTIWYTAPDAWSSAVCIAAQRSLRCVYHKLNVYGIKIY